jgi:hypothetical protein
MNDRFSYSGVVTLIHKVAGKTISKEYHNSGSQRLFEAYARALSGQDISDFIPRCVRIYNVRQVPENGVVNTYKSEATKNSIPIMVTYRSGEEDGATIKRPHTRVTGIFQKNMIDDSTPNGNGEIQLYSSKTDLSGRELASLEIPSLINDIKSMTDGAQYILVWDLYVENDTNNTTMEEINNAV